MYPRVYRDDFHGLVNLSATLDPTPSIVHLHWPEMLAYAAGVKATIAFLHDLHERDARIVQAIHNLWPHDTRMDLREFFRRVDEMTAGIHVFSGEHVISAGTRGCRTSHERTFLSVVGPKYPVARCRETR